MSALPPRTVVFRTSAESNFALARSPWRMQGARFEPIDVDRHQDRDQDASDDPRQEQFAHILFC